VAGKLVPVAAKGVVRLVERLKGRGKGTEVKKPMADSILADLFKLAEQLVPGLGLPQGGEVGAIIQAAWEELNSAGKLKGEATALDPDAESTPAMPVLSKGTMLLCAAVLEREAAQLRKAAEDALD
jgi:hypothetical protein